MFKFFLFLSGALYLFSLSWKNLLGFWICMEAAGLILLCGFFSYKHMVKRYLGLLYYLLVSGISSGLMFSGMISSDYQALVLLGFMVKMGIFPFISWVMNVYTNVGWILLFYLLVISKVVMLYLPSFKEFMHGNVLMVSVCINLLLVSFLFWFNCFSIKTFLALSGVGSGSVLLYIISQGKLMGGLLLYSLYSLIMMMCFNFFYTLEGLNVSTSKGVVLFFLLFGMPCSIMIFYKFVGLSLLVGLNLYLLFCWLFMGISEQVYLLNFYLEKLLLSNSW